MEIILLQDVANLGYKDDIVKVKNGYANNYLLPNRMAIIATPSNRKVLAETLRQRAHGETPQGGRDPDGCCQREDCAPHRQGW